MAVRGDPLDAAAAVAVALEKLGVRYAVGGSIASSLYGVPRATQDADIVASLNASHAPRLVAALEAEFYVDEEMIRDAVRRQGTFNVVHLETMFKVDVFVAKDDDWCQEELRRARRERVGDVGAQVELVFASPEDTLLHKLVWFRMGGGVSERQWRDAVGVLRIQGEALDRGYLDTWASRLGVRDLLDKACGEIAG
ncbi:MAG: hypothetical protein M0R80_00210 [Proteobacteria bacterium]|nr:hypothetical protein [Pseudomonadota bacterium]